MTIYTVIPLSLVEDILNNKNTVKSFTDREKARIYAEDSTDIRTIIENEVVDFLEDGEPFACQHLIDGTYQVVGLVSGNVYVQDTYRVCQDWMDL